MAVVGPLNRGGADTAAARLCIIPMIHIRVVHRNLGHWMSKVKSIQRWRLWQVNIKRFELFAVGFEFVFKLFSLSHLCTRLLNLVVQQWVGVLPLKKRNFILIKRLQALGPRRIVVI